MKGGKSKGEGDTHNCLFCMKFPEGEKASKSRVDTAGQKRT